MASKDAYVFRLELGKENLVGKASMDVIIEQIPTVGVVFLENKLS